MVHDIDSDLVGIGGRGGHDVGLGGGHDSSGRGGGGRGCRCGWIGFAVVVGVIHFVVDRSWTTRTELKTSKFYPVNVKWHFLMNFFFMPSVIPKFHFLCAILSCFKIRPTSPCATFLAVCDWRG